MSGQELPGITLDGNAGRIAAPGSGGLGFPPLAV